MSEPKFTPGPWRYIKDIPHCVDKDTGYGLYKVCGMDYQVSGSAAKTKEEMVANGYLIAAAPEMYELLDMIRKAVSLDAGILGSCIGKIEPLLKKARGEE